MFNRAILIGRITAEPELRQTPNGISVCSFSLAVDRRYSSKGSEKQTDFINIVAWRQQAEFVTNYFGKGRMILVEGELQTRAYTDKNGNQATWYEIAADRLSFTGESRQGNEPPVEHGAPPVPSAPAASADTTAADDDYPF